MTIKKKSKAKQKGNQSKERKPLRNAEQRKEKVWKENKRAKQSKGQSNGNKREINEKERKPKKNHLKSREMRRRKK